MTVTTPGPCRGCGKTLPLSSKQCPDCGTKRPVSVTSTMTDRGKLIYLLVIVALVVFIFSGGCDKLLS